ncbi:MAG TPA: YigZ family protein [Candidatus Cloacimonadota bacterium]|jgi:uncharacterized YigZ family protein|nr:MAG: IMPACT family member YigZ [Bacteroidetes bacterium ADurb.Bin145]HOU02164.1 YigZ family protein [Bacteroidales bacterium]HPM02740.1 YigZ family protein [Candidatus Cloacimonadota bacterium]HQK67536.1 YigZ family protein [Bacteroidales bacterium]
MERPDTYKTIKSPSEGLYKEKGSRFIACAWPAGSETEIKAILDETRRKYHDARHHSYGYVIGADSAIWRVNDDGEPSGTAGRPIIGQIRSFGLTNVLVVVSRYFGGKLLGASGLANAYKMATRSALSNAEIIDRIVTESFELKFPYSSLSTVMKILKEYNVEQAEHTFDIECIMVITIRLSLKETVLSHLSRVGNITVDKLF